MRGKCKFGTACKYRHSREFEAYRWQQTVDNRQPPTNSNTRTQRNNHATDSHQPPFIQPTNPSQQQQIRKQNTKVIQSQTFPQMMYPTTIVKDLVSYPPPTLLTSNRREELERKENERKSRIECNHWMIGRCRLGTSCKYQHSREFEAMNHYRNGL